MERVYVDDKFQPLTKELINRLLTELDSESSDVRFKAATDLKEVASKLGREDATILIDKIIRNYKKEDGWYTVLDYLSILEDIAERYPRLILKQALELILHAIEYKDTTISYNAVCCLETLGKFKKSLLSENFDKLLRASDRSVKKDIKRHEEPTKNPIIENAELVPPESEVKVFWRTVKRKWEFSGPLLLLKEPDYYILLPLIITKGIHEIEVQVIEEVIRQSKAKKYGENKIVGWWHSHTFGNTVVVPGAGDMPKMGMHPKWFHLLLVQPSLKFKKAVLWNPRRKKMESADIVFKKTPKIKEILRRYETRVYEKAVSRGKLKK